MSTTFKQLDSFIKEIEQLKEAYSLLESLYEEIGPYRDKQPSEETWHKVLTFFGFDDSE